MPKQKNSHKILKSVALAGALTATGAVATTAHADTVATSTAATSATTTDQQLANMKSAHAATESSAAASNAAAMNSATTSANSQIADLNNQIQTRQASDAAMQQASQASAIASVNQAATSATDAENASYSQAVASQTAANNAALKSAQATIVTEQQKNQETAQENADYQNQAGNLDSEHNATLNQLDQALKNNTDGTNFAIQKEISRQKTDEQGAIDRAAKQFDSQISAADTEVGKAQQAVNADQDVVNAKDAANKAANQAVSRAQDKLSGTQDALKQAEANQPVVNTIDTPAEYINVWKDYLQTKKPGGWTLSKSDYPELYTRLQKAEQEAVKQSNYQEDPAAKQVKVTLNPNGTLSRDDIIFATQYAASLINPIREAIGTTPYKITNASIDVAQEVENGYRNDNWNTWDDGHDNNRLGQIAKNWGTSMVGESWAGDGSFGKLRYDENTRKWTHDYSNLSRNDLQRGIYNAVKALLFECEKENSTSSNGHTTDLLGVRAANSHGIVAGDILGIGFDYGQGMESSGQVNVGGFHFDSLVDGNSERTKQMHADGGVFKSGSSEDKTIQGSNYDQIAIPSANKDDQIKQLQAAVASDQQALNDAKSKASATASELKSAQDKLASDQAKLSQAQKRVTELRTNKENTLKAMATDPMQSPQVKQLQAKLAQARADHDNDVKAENTQYAAKAKDLKTKHEAKLAAIAAQPTSLAELQSQLQAKLDTLKAQHEAKLKQITDDANAKIAAIKNQKVADRQIDKLNAQIAQIKSDLAKKQQELDNNYQALKTKNQAEYDALAKKLHETDKAVVNGNSDKYVTSDGKTVVMAGGKTSSDSVATTTSVKNAVATSGKETSDVTTVKVEPGTSSVEMTREAYKAQQAKLPQTGNNNSTALIALGAIASMFGFGLVAKKRY
ncbi:SEC10/PgrA surface exclusion domain-containing protein [Limosilactobacillus reuteri]|uniref:SEC10/PgrA surface exclusion domain-containing protein n=1 Tax=Limosilactobacillus reuteri TaxID=1598 RepID=UPI00129B01CD|nr:SEC10/PgrA surface exclusion domain-containing protein [Limosilactobacillus reuteri]MRI08597.1 SEC10/PgrA surface exclusion domain-containing protein [Limosilactobacillus reuteri]